ncbi:hypothetical protein ABG067_007811, partial [Albugo candida]
MSYQYSSFEDDDTFICPDCNFTSTQDKQINSHIKQCVIDLEKQNVSFEAQPSFEFIDYGVDCGDDNFSVAGELIHENIIEEDADDSIDILRYIPDQSKVKAYIKTGLRIYYKYITSAMTLDACNTVYSIVKSTLIETKQEELTTIYDKL